MTWSLASALARKLVAVPPANLVANIGFGPDATRTDFAADFRGDLPTGRVTFQARRPPPRPDMLFDRWTLLVELLAAQRDGKALPQLAKARHLVSDPRLSLHLAPFDHARESVAVLSHLLSVGTRSSHLDAVLARMQSAARDARSEAS